MKTTNNKRREEETVRFADEKTTKGLALVYRSSRKL